MKKLIVLFLIFSFCGGSSETITVEDTTTSSTTTSSTSTSTSTTTKVSSTRILNISIYDDSTTDPYSLVNIEIKSPTYNKTWEPDLEYGSDKLKFSPIEIGEIGEIILTFDSKSIAIPICFSPTEDSKGDLGSIWIVLNDKDIEVDGLPVQDIVINRSDQYVMNLNDSSKPEC
tara:strand:- start:75 stop:593 length:519 start_codon:yes stop_codon:yes gene_type:complete